ncbi:MAG: TonB-dependent receptor [Pseudomonadota bacterium]
MSIYTTKSISFKDFCMNGSIQNIYRPMLLIFLILLATLVPDVLPADGNPSISRTDTETDSHNLGKIVVTGSRTPTRQAEEMTVPVQVITREKLQEIGAVSLADALEVVQGVEFIQSPDLNAAPGVQTLRMRGMDANHVLVLIDGRRQPGTRPDNQGVSFTDIGSININNIERIEVLRDGASAQYGSDAVAGVINIVMKKQNPGLAFNSQYGLSARNDAEEKHVDINTCAPVGESLFVNLSANAKQTDHYDRTPDNPRWTTPDIDQAGANLKLSWDINDHHLLDTDIRYTTTESIIRKGVSGDIPQDRINQKTDRHGSLRWEGDFEPVSVEVGGGASLSDTEYRHSEDPDYNGDLESEWMDVYTHQRWVTVPWLNVFTGCSYNREDIDASQRDFVEDRDITAFFAETAVTLFGKMELQLSGRIEDYSDFGTDFAPKVSARYEVFDGLALRTSVSQSYQVPTLYQLHDRLVGAMGWNDIYGNPNLQPAEGVNMSAGVVWKPFRERDTRISVDTYQNRIDNLIETDVVQEKTETGNAETTYVNLDGTSVFKGVEAELTTSLDYGFRLDLIAEYLKARDPDKQDLTNRPRSRINAILSYQLGENFRANLRYNYRGKYLSDKEPYKKIRYFDYLNAQISYVFFTRYTLYLGVRNLLDEKPPVDIADYEYGHMESMLDSPLGAYYYGGIRFIY